MVFCYGAGNKRNNHWGNERLFPAGVITFVLICLPATVIAADLMSVTWDNDLFLSKDDGYTNGLHISWFDLGNKSNVKPKPLFLVRPLHWSLSGEQPALTVNAHTIGQIMMTPEDTSAENPDPNDIPYAGLLFYSNSHLKIYDSHVDNIGVTLGLVGPASGAEAVQKFVHDKISGTEPRGWDYQLKNELVFQFARSRVRRAWAMDTEKTGADLLTASDVRLGTLESSVGGSIMFRFGKGLSGSFASSALRGNRAINPLAVEGGWNIYIGVQGKYIGNMIFVNGNTFRNSRSVDLDPTQVGLLAGFSYSWSDASLTLAAEDMSFFEDQYKSLARFGTLTFAWRL